MAHRFSRTEKILGPEGMKTLARSKVAIIGLGGVGSFAAEALARSGVGFFRLVDPDRVDITNINRQLHALDSTIGRAKVKLVAERMAAINPEVSVELYQEPFSRENSGTILRPGLSYVVDAIDDLDNKVILLKKCADKRIPVVSAMGMGNKLDPTALKVEDVSRTSVCPLARAVRRELRREKVFDGIKVVYSLEKPVPKGRGGPPGSTAFVPPAAGMILAGVVVNALLGRN